MKSLEQRLYEACRANRGLRLSADDVYDLVIDDAVATRISNVACIEAGAEEGGHGCIVMHNMGPWKKFVDFMKG